MNRHKRAALQIASLNTELLASEPDICEAQLLNNLSVFSFDTVTGANIWSPLRIIFLCSLKLTFQYSSCLQCQIPLQPLRGVFTTADTGPGITFLPLHLYCGISLIQQRSVFISSPLHHTLSFKPRCSPAVLLCTITLHCCLLTPFLCHSCNWPLFPTSWRLFSKPISCTVKLTQFSLLKTLWMFSHVCLWGHRRMTSSHYSY